jgi:hypothetical protein
MKTLRRVFLGTALGAALALGSARAGSDVSTASWDALSLVGTWQFEMTVRFEAEDCTTSAEIPFGPNPFPGLVSFHQGGTLSEYGSRTPPGVRTTGFGSWKRTGLYKYKARHTFMEFDVDGALSRTMVIEQTLNLSKKGNDYTAVGRLELTDVSGNVTRLCTTIEGARFKA